MLGYLYNFRDRVYFYSVDLLIFNGSYQPEYVEISAECWIGYS